MHASYVDPLTDVLVELEVNSETLEAAMNEAWRCTSDRGMPIVEFVAENGSSLVFARAGKVAVLVWTDTAGDERHSLGDRDEELLVADYFGSYTEFPGNWAISLNAALHATRIFLETGKPVAEEVILVAD